MLQKDKQYHIIVSCLLTLMCKPIAKTVIPVVAIGAATEMMDYQKERDIKHASQDMLANLAGIALGLLLLKFKNNGKT